MTDPTTTKETLTDGTDREIACRLPDAEQDRQWEDVKRFVREELVERGESLQV